MRRFKRVACLAFAGAIAFAIGVAGGPVQALQGQVDQASAAAGVVKVTPAKKASGIYSIKISQKKINATDAVITVGKVKSLKKAGIKTIKVQATMSYGKKVMVKAGKTISLSKLTATKNKVAFKLPQFGAYKVSVKYYGPKKALRKTLKISKLGIAAEEYNIAMLVGTYSPLVFTMMMYDDNNITVKNGRSIPTYVALTRPNAYNWKALPKNVKSNPLTSSPKTGTFAYKRRAMAAYVKSLKAANKYSKYNVYVTDIALTSVMDVIYANKIGDSRVKVCMLSDGTASAHYFNELYNNPKSAYTPAKLNVKIACDYNLTQSKVMGGQKVDYTKMAYAIKGESSTLAAGRYSYAALCSHDNYSWVMGYMGAFASTNAAFLQEAKDSMTSFSIAPDLERIKALGNSAAFKRTFHLSDTLFSAAKSANKKIMVIMGTRVNLETNFEPFAKFVKKYYGNGYMYYYKGHPATNTKEYPEKQAQLKRLGMIDVDSSIAAELIIFYNPEIYVSGLSNSTLNSSYQAGHTGAYLNTRLANKDKIINGDLFQMFFTKIDGSYEPEVLELVKGDTSLSHSYLVELNDGTNDIAIYDSLANTITKYGKTESGYEKK